MKIFCYDLKNSVLNRVWVEMVISGHFGAIIREFLRVCY